MHHTSFIRYVPAHVAALLSRRLRRGQGIEWACWTWWFDSVVKNWKREREAPRKQCVESSRVENLSSVVLWRFCGSFRRDTLFSALYYSCCRLDANVNPIRMRPLAQFCACWRASSLSICIKNNLTRTSHHRGNHKLGARILLCSLLIKLVLTSKMKGLQRYASYVMYDYYFFLD